MRLFPGVELVRPFVDTRSFIERADLVVAIQGTMGLEAALLGKPVIMLGESPVTKFRNASNIGELEDLPELVRSKLSEPKPTRRQNRRRLRIVPGAALTGQSQRLDAECRRSGNRRLCAPDQAARAASLGRLVTPGCIA